MQNRKRVRVIQFPSCGMTSTFLVVNKPVVYFFFVFFFWLLRVLSRALQQEGCPIREDSMEVKQTIQPNLEDADYFVLSIYNMVILAYITRLGKYNCE